MALFFLGTFEQPVTETKRPFIKEKVATLAQARRFCWGIYIQ